MNKKYMDIKININIKTDAWFTLTFEKVHLRDLYCLCTIFSGKPDALPIF